MAFYMCQCGASRSDHEPPSCKVCGVCGTTLDAPGTKPRQPNIHEFVDIGSFPTVEGFNEVIKRCLHCDAQTFCIE